MGSKRPLPILYFNGQQLRLADIIHIATGVFCKIIILLFARIANEVLRIAKLTAQSRSAFVMASERLMEFTSEIQSINKKRAGLR